MLLGMVGLDCALGIMKLCCVSACLDCCAMAVGNGRSKLCTGFPKSAHCSRNLIQYG